MKTTSSLLLLLTLLAFATSTKADVKEECKALNLSGPNYYELCVASLLPVPGSSTADTTTLAVMFAKLAMANASSTIIKIKTLVKKETNKMVKLVLKDCRDSYSSVIDNVRSARNSVKSKAYDDANVMVSAALTDMETCKDEFESEVSPITKETNDMYSLLVVLIRFVVKLGKQRV